MNKDRPQDILDNAPLACDYQSAAGRERAELITQVRRLARENERLKAELAELRRGEA